MNDTVVFILSCKNRLEYSVCELYQVHQNIRHRQCKIFDSKWNISRMVIRYQCMYIIL